VPAGQQQDRYTLLNQALDLFAAIPGVDVYLDGANSGCTPAPEMARRPLLAGVAKAQGFAVNVRNAYPTATEASSAEQFSARTGGAHYGPGSEQHAQPGEPVPVMV
jgi:endoglucanase